MNLPLPENTPPIAQDPYDPWMTRLGVYAKHHFYQGHLQGKLLSIGIAVADWLFPNSLRSLLKAPPRSYPITTAQWILSQDVIANPDAAYRALMSTASSKAEEFGTSWGLGFPWMSKNGLYDEDMPFVTHTPYALEALLKLSQYPSTQAQALLSFNDSWRFLESLLVMHETDDELALSYAPIEEPRMVINANAYACYSYCLHAAHGEHKAVALAKATKLACWVMNQQQENGSWYYYADQEPGNFIDCFHSCFVIKNLFKAATLNPDIKQRVEASITQARHYIDQHFVDPKAGLVKRFTDRDIKDPYVWDIYDQAEYLGILLLQEEYQTAANFRTLIEKTFYANGHWYCKTDILGRKWGRDFMRWGIMPYLHQAHLLDNKPAPKQ